MTTDEVSVKVAAKALGYSEQYLCELCRKGKIRGARRVHDTSRWLIPRSTVAPKTATPPEPDEPAPATTDVPPDPPKPTG